MNFALLLGMELVLVTALFCVPIICVDLEFLTLLNAASSGRKAVFVFLVLCAIVVVGIANYVLFYSYGWNLSCCNALAQYQKKLHLASKTETLYPSATTANAVQLAAPRAPSVRVAITPAGK